METVRWEATDVVFDVDDVDLPTSSCCESLDDMESYATDCKVVSVSLSELLMRI